MFTVSGGLSLGGDDPISLAKKSCRDFETPLRSSCEEIPGRNNINGLFKQAFRVKYLAGLDSSKETKTSVHTHKSVLAALIEKTLADIEDLNQPISEKQLKSLRLAIKIAFKGSDNRPDVEGLLEKLASDTTLA
ncbi:MAG: hypothetical protein ACI9BD_001345 [Candidatus Marinamargulisbacteria bacterium]|jgi:hypothetical protein